MGVTLGPTHLHQRAGENPLKESLEIYNDIIFLSSNIYLLIW